MSGYVNDNSLFNRRTQLAALRLIAIGSPTAAAHAAKGLATTSGAARQLRIDFVVPLALADPRADWTDAQREQLILAMGTPPEEAGDTWTPPAT